MALAKTCDRCGKFYSYYDTRHHFNGIRLAKIKDNGLISDTGPSMDLCDECMDILQRFLDGENLVPVAEVSAEECSDEPRN